jgi:hypothetical protein
LATPKTRAEELRQMRLVWFCFIISIPLYAYIGETMPRFSWLSFPNAGKTFAILAALHLLSFSWALRKRYSPTVGAVRTEPEDMLAVKRWMASWTILIGNANSVVLFGFALRMGGKTLQRSLPFYVVGALLILSLWARQIWPSTKMAAP